MKKILFILGFLSVMANAYTIKNIQINGLQRLDTGTVLNYLPVKAGDKIDNTDTIIQKLYDTGFFTDIRIENSSNTLIINLIERPIISSINLTGDSEFDHDNLLKSMQKNGLTIGKIFDTAMLDQVVLSLKAEYYNRGYYAVKINKQVTQLTRNRVAISIVITEGDKARIKQITITGNNVYSQKKLLNLIFLNTGNYLSWWYKDNQYSSDKLYADLETIKAYYLNRGYIKFKINSVQVQLSPNQDGVYLVINIDEGKKYKVKSVTLSGDSKDVTKNSLEKSITVKANQTINQAKVNETINLIKDNLGNYGYAYAAVKPITEFDESTLQVSYNFFIDLGKKIYVRNVVINGNNKTRDVVIRRELRQNEASLYNEAQIKRSKVRLDLTGYFKKTEIAPKQSDTAEDEVDLDVNVDEKDTGFIKFAVGYAQGQGVLLNGGISQANLLGSGKYASLNASTSLIQNGITLSFTDPYYKTNGTSLGYDIYNNNYTPNLANISPYSTSTIGARIRSGIPLSDIDTINLGLSFENNQISLTGSNVPTRYQNFTSIYGSSVNSIPLSISWINNSTDSYTWPTQGSIFDERVEVNLPITGPKYYKFTSANMWFVPLTNKLTWKINAQLGYIDSYDAGQVPFYQYYTAGGINSIRGYSISTLGPKDTDGLAVGGTRQAILSNDFLIPMPGVKDEQTVRLSAFADVGAIWGGSNFNLSFEQSIRGSYGFGLIWANQQFPMKFAYALPLFNQPNDNLQTFQYMIGTSF